MTLEAQVDAFAADLTQTVQRSIVDASEARFEAVMAPDAEGPVRRVAVHSDPRTIPLRVQGEELLGLTARFQCRWDHQGRYLAVDESNWKITYRDEANPLVRLEYLSAMRTTTIPTSHWHVHAHRDELLYAMVLSERGRPGRRVRGLQQTLSGPPRLSDLHLPTGGARMRPCLEDLLTFAIEEFGIDTIDGWEESLAQGRERWRRHQIGALVRDSPADAARVLRECGYLVTPPEGGEPPTESAKLQRY